MSIPDRESARFFAWDVFGSLDPKSRRVRFRLCELLEEAVTAAADTEEIEVLRAASYLQEVGVIHSSRRKALYSLHMCEQVFRENVGDLDPRLVDCIRNHELDGHPATPEGVLMRICHKYAATHFLDYLHLKYSSDPQRMEKLFMKRIDDYARMLREHARGNAIGQVLHAVFYGARQRRRGECATSGRIPQMEEGALLGLAG